MIAVRNRLMFEEFGPVPAENSRGTIGLPMALTTYELFPFYARLIMELGYEAVLSAHSKIGNTKTAAAICYPCMIFWKKTWTTFYSRTSSIWKSPPEASNTNPFTARMAKKIYSEYGRKCRVVEKSDPEAMQAEIPKKRNDL